MAERQYTEHAPKGRVKGAKAHGKPRTVASSPEALDPADLEERIRQYDDWAAGLSALVSVGKRPDSLAIAVGTLLARRAGLGATSTPSPGRPVPKNAPAGSILSGLTDLIGKLRAGGAAPQVNSWIGPGANQPIQPDQLSSALGEKTLDELAQRTGMSQQELLRQLAGALPQLINHLTPHGRLPTEAWMRREATSEAPVRNYTSMPPGVSKGGNFNSIPSAVAATGAVTVTLADGIKMVSRGAERFSYVAGVSKLLGGRRVLGSSIESELEAHELLRRGLPREALSTLIEKLHVIGFDEASEALGVSVRTLQRHKHTPVAPLNLEQSGRTWKFAEILDKATRVLGSQDEAEQWLGRPAIGLDQQRPIDLLTTPAGVQLVEDYLGRLEYDGYT